VKSFPKITSWFSFRQSACFAFIITEGMTMKTAELARILLESVNDSISAMLSETGIQKEWISKAEAYRQYGRSHVDRWIAEGLFKPLSGRIFISPSGIDRVKLEQIAAASNRNTYLPVVER
jgi:hypothetical protein